jgi:hypothetical protein
LLYQPANGEDLAERNGMNPDHTMRLRWRGRLNQPLWGQAQALGESFAILAVAQNLVEPIRETQQHSKRQQQTVEKITQAEPF